MCDLHRIQVAVLAANAMVNSGLDCCMSLFRGLSCLNQHKLQTIQNTLALKPPSHIKVFNRRQMAVIKPSPTFLTSSLNLILPPSTLSYLPWICHCHGNFGCVQNFRLVIENHFSLPHTEVKPNFIVCFSRSRSSFSANFHLENIHHRYRR